MFHYHLMCPHVCVFVSSPGYCLENFIKARADALGEGCERLNSSKIQVTSLRLFIPQ